MSFKILKLSIKITYDYKYECLNAEVHLIMIIKFIFQKKKVECPVKFYCCFSHQLFKLNLSLALTLSSDPQN